MVYLSCTIQADLVDPNINKYMVYLSCPIQADLVDPNINKYIVYLSCPIQAEHLIDTVLFSYLINDHKYGMQRVEPLDKDKWRSCCGSNRPTRASMEKRTL